MITLKLNEPIEVNQDQYKLIQAKYSWLIAYRKEDGKFFIKPLCYFGRKKQIEEALNKLKPE